MNNLLEKYTEHRRSGLLIPFNAMPRDGDYRATFGSKAEEVVRTIADAGFSKIHELPGTPPDAFDCPYSSVSAFALDAYRIDPDRLTATGDITLDELNTYQNLVSSCDAGPAIKLEKEMLLRRAFMNFDNDGSAERKESFAKWRTEEAYWLDSYTAFEILKMLPQNQGKRWQDWETGKDCSPELVGDLKTANRKEFSEIAYMQWVAEEQTLHYQKFARYLGIEIWGDVPFYVGDGEVWANREIFNLDAVGNQLNQAGAAPSATSETGQLWGNATYNIDPKNNPTATAKAIDWWVKRLRRSRKLNSGEVRLDHFIAFAEPHISETDAVDGSKGWREEGMGSMLFDRLVAEFGTDLPFYPEDLGSMTQATPDLRDKYGLLSTKLVVRAITKELPIGCYDSSQNNPDNYPEGAVAFSGNHDSPTLIQAIDGVRVKHPEGFSRYIQYLRQQSPGIGLDLQTSSAEFAKHEMERVVRSVARYSFIGIWDALGLGPKGRYNVPGTVGPTNWSWSMDDDDHNKLRDKVPYLRELNRSSNRLSQVANNPEEIIRHSSKHHRPSSLPNTFRGVLAALDL